MNNIPATAIKAKIVYSIDPESSLMYDAEFAPITMVFRNQGIPSDKSMFIVFAPKALEIPIPPSPLRDIIAKDIDSGRQPPAARKVRPRTASGIPNTCPEKGKPLLMPCSIIYSVTYS